MDDNSFAEYNVSATMELVERIAVLVSEYGGYLSAFRPAGSQLLEVTLTIINEKS